MDKIKTSLNQGLKSKVTPLFVAALLVGAGAGVTGMVSAAADTPDTQAAMTMKGGPDHKFGGHRGPGVMGKVTAVNGDTITLTNDDGTSYTVNASDAKISKVVDQTISDIKIGDTLGVQGEVSGSTVMAKHIMNGMPPRPQAPPAQTE